MKLIIGEKNWSTWSMRAWLVAKRTGARFDVEQINLRRDDTPDQIRAWSPSSKVPALIDGDLLVWDSLAIGEYLAEKFPGLWPGDPAARARVRSACAEMHSGFGALRRECPMDLKVRTVAEVTPEVAADVRRIVALWKDLRRRNGVAGPFLAGAWSIADAFYTPVATRFRTYGIDLAAHGDDGTAGAYLDALLSTPEFLEWERGALAEPDAPPRPA